MDELNFSGTKLPLVRGIIPKLTENLISVQPISTPSAGDRPIKRYPIKYDHFRSQEDLEEYIRMELRVKHHGIWLKAEWLSVGQSVSLPMNVWSDVFYSSSPMIYNIKCFRPQKNILNRPHGITLCQLDPESWSMEVILSAIDAVKQNNYGHSGYDPE